MGRIIIALLLVVAAVAGIGYYRDWFTVSSKEKESGKVEVAMTIEKENIAKDTKTVVDETKKGVKSARENAQKLLGREIFKGTIKSVDSKNGSLTVVPKEKEPVSFQTNNDTQIKRQGKTISLGDLKDSEKVIVVYSVTEGQNIARSITVETE